MVVESLRLNRDNCRAPLLREYYLTGDEFRRWPQ
jgi:hypothetical protein